MTYQHDVPASRDFKASRINMVNGQLLTNGIHAPALVAVYRETPRERFVDLALADRAYLDEDVNIVGTNRWLLEPLVEARMLQHALSGGCRSALAVGAASLPSIEMLAGFVNHLVVVEGDRGLASAAHLRLERPNVDIVDSVLAEPCGRTGPYDIIFMTGAVAAVPADLLEKLAHEGQLVAVLREKPNGVGRIVAVRRLAEDTFETICYEDASTPYLQGFEPENGFIF